MEYAEQTSDVIRLYLAKGDFNINQFTVIERTSFAWKEFAIDFGILGESHFVSLRRGNDYFHEICACTETIDKGTSELVRNTYLTDLETLPVTGEFLNLRYSFSFSREGWAEGLRRLEYFKQKEHTADIHFLRHTFPSNDMTLDKPVTEIYVGTEDKIHTSSVHTYPNEGIMVFTESILMEQ